MEELISRAYLATGTCKDNRSDKCPISEKNFLKHQPRGVVHYRMSNDILLMKCKDNKEVTVVSNFHSTIMKSARRYDRKKMIKVPQPACIQLYNAHIGYVDVMNQAVSTYRIRLQKKKWWWWPIFFYFLSVTVNNDYQLMKRKITSMTHYQFIEALTLYYCKSLEKPSIQK